MTQIPEDRSEDVGNCAKWELPKSGFGRTRVALLGDLLRRGFDVPKLAPATIDTETLALLNAASDAAKTSQAEALRQCIRAHAPAMIAAHSNPLPAAEIVKLFKFDRNRVAEVKEVRRGHR